MLLNIVMEQSTAVTSGFSILQCRRFPIVGKSEVSPVQIPQEQPQMFRYAQHDGALGSGLVRGFESRARCLQPGNNPNQIPPQTAKTPPGGGVFVQSV
jgi:hypothetical protein